MILYFQNAHGIFRKIGTIDGRMTPEKITTEISRQINEFCKERNFTIYYTRIWDTEVNGKPMTKFDVGSHVEFFYTHPRSYAMFEAQHKQEAEGG